MKKYFYRIARCRECCSAAGKAAYGVLRLRNFSARISMKTLYLFFLFLVKNAPHDKEFLQHIFDTKDKDPSFVGKDGSVLAF